MIKLKNVTFLILQSHTPQYYIGLLPKYTINYIEIPEYIYKDLYKYGLDNSIALYLIGWFYKHNEEHLRIKDIEKVIIQGWDEISIDKS